MSVCPSHKRHRFGSRRDAKAHARTLSVNGWHLHAYRCPWCSFWHVTSQEPRTSPDVLQCINYAFDFVRPMFDNGYTLDSSNAPIFCVYADEDDLIGEFAVSGGGDSAPLCIYAVSPEVDRLRKVCLEA
jgi:hypothetical protein